VTVKECYCCFQIHVLNEILPFVSIVMTKIVIKLLCSVTKIPAAASVDAAVEIVYVPVIIVAVEAIVDAAETVLQQHYVM
jgi:hypothetical protein